MFDRRAITGTRRSEIVPCESDGSPGRDSWFSPKQERDGHQPIVLPVLSSGTDGGTAGLWRKRVPHAEAGVDAFKSNRMGADEAVWLL